MKKLSLLSFLLLFFCAFADAQSLKDRIFSAFKRLQADNQCEYASVSLTVLDAKTGEQIFAGNPKMGLSPGSTLKTVTTISAFNILGGDFKYQTQFGYNGTITNGTLNGDVIIKGGGDPTLGSSRWEATKEDAIISQMMVALKKAGIKKINGRIIGDDSAYGTQAIPDGWIVQDLGTYYGAGANALCWRENQFDINLKTGAVGTPISITGTTPIVPYLTYKSELTNAPSGTGDNAYPYLPTPGSSIMYLRGTFAIDQPKKSVGAAMPDPAYHIAYSLHFLLNSFGLVVTGSPESTLTLLNKSEKTPAITNDLTTITSPSLSQIVYWTNRKSINLYAEQLLKAIAVKSGKAATTLNGVDALQAFWKTRGIDPNSMDIADGSGLSPADKITTATIASLLKSARKESWYNDFYESLPIYNDMHMKSGSIHNVQAYAGYHTKNGRQLCFSIIVSNYNGSTRAIKDKMFRVLDELK